MHATPETLTCGPVSAVLDGLSLRWITWGGTEILRGVGFVFRDAAWATLMPQVETVSCKISPDRVALELRGTLQGLSVKVSIAIAPDAVTLRGTATADAEFLTNRVGFVVLHGEACAGTPVTVEHGDGRVTHGMFPDRISPHQPFLDIAVLTHAPLPGVSARLALIGESFEMEDHRNWSDAGFKTYGRPLSRPRPFVIPAGTALSQEVRLTVSAASDVRPRIARGAPAARFTVPQPGPEMLLAETRTGLDLDGVRHAAAGAPFAVMLAGEGDRLAEIAAIAAAGPLEALLIAHPTPASLEAARTLLPGTPIGGGSAAHFAEFNRRPPPPGIDIAFWGVSATVHASDDASVLETLRVLGDQARTARTLAPGARLWVGPIGIGPRWEADPRDAGSVGLALRAGHLAAWGAAGVQVVIFAIADRRCRAALS